jgi:hypothetical protein
VRWCSTEEAVPGAQILEQILIDTTPLLRKIVNALCLEYFAPWNSKPWRNPKKPRIFFKHRNESVETFLVGPESLDEFVISQMPFAEKPT